jgi:hypothetical protein
MSQDVTCLDDLWWEFCDWVLCAFYFNVLC